MILTRWFNAYLTEGGFRLGEGFEHADEAERNTNEYPDFIHDVFVPVEVEHEEIQRANR